MKELEIHDIPEKEAPKRTKKEVAKMKEAIPAFSAFAFIEKFDESFKKQKKLLTKGETLFRPGEDPHFYIIVSGTFAIIRQTENGWEKEVWRAYAGSFMGEWILFGNNTKTVTANALSDTAEVIALTEADIRKLEFSDPKEAINFYKHILLKQTNERLLDTGKELADIYELTNKLTELAKDGEKWFPDILQLIQNSLWFDVVVFVEQHPLIENLFSQRYDTRHPWEVTHIRWEQSTPTSLEHDSFPEIAKYTIAIPLRTGIKNKGFCILWKEKHPIKDMTSRVVTNLAPVLASIVENNQQERDKKYLDMKKG